MHLDRVRGRVVLQVNEAYREPVTLLARVLVNMSMPVSSDRWHALCATSPQRDVSKRNGPSNALEAQGDGTMCFLYAYARVVLLEVAL